MNYNLGLLKHNQKPYNLSALPLYAINISDSSYFGYPLLSLFRDDDPDDEISIIDLKVNGSATFPSWMSYNSIWGLLQFYPRCHSGSYVLQFSVTDGKYKSANSPISITFTVSNRPPVLKAPLPKLWVLHGSAFTCSLDFG